TRVSIPDNDIFALTNSLTIEGWVNIAGDGGVIFFRGDDRIAFDPFALTMGSGRIIFTIESASAQVSMDAAITYRQWHHVAATLEGTSGAMSIYIDGVLASQTTTTVRPIGALDPSSNPALGIGNTGGTQYDFSF